MDRKTQDSSDDIVKRLQALYDDPDGVARETADEKPEDVFTDHQAAAKREDDDGFDQYMAQLLGELIGDNADAEPKTPDTPDADTNESAGTDRSPIDDFILYDKDPNVPPDLPTPAADDETALTPEPTLSEDLPEQQKIVFDIEHPLMEEEEEEPEPAEYEPVEPLPVAPPDPEPIPDEPSDTPSDLPVDDAPIAYPFDDSERFEQAENRAEDAADAAAEPSDEEKSAPLLRTSVEVTLPTDAQTENLKDASEEQPLVTPAQAIEAPATPAVSDTAPELMDASSEIPDDASAKIDAPAGDDEQAEEQPLLREGDILLDEYDEVPPVAPAPEKEPEPAAPANEPAPENATSAPKPKPSPLDAFAKGNLTGKSNVRGTVPTRGLSADETAQKAHRDRTLSDEDVELLLNLGYENNLTQKIGSERVESVKYRSRESQKDRRLLRRCHGCDGEEYTAHSQDKTIRKNYRKATNRSAVRLILTALLSIVLLVADLFPLYRSDLPDAASLLPENGMFALVGIVLLTLIAWLSRRNVVSGISSLLRFEPTTASVPAVLYVLTMIYGIIAIFSGEHGILLFAPTALSFMFLSLGDLLTVRQERLTFEVVSARSRKIIVEKTEPKKKKVVRDGHIVKIINDDAGQKLYRVRPTDFVAGYFHRTAERPGNYRSVSYLLAIVPLLSAALALAVWVLTENLRDAATAFLLSVQMAMPISLLTGFSYPLFIASRNIARSGCAIIGQHSVDEYAGKKTLIFDDKEMFSSKSSTEITIKGSGDSKKYVRYAKRLFQTLGGTLQNITTSDLSDDTYEDRVEILRINDDGLEACINGKIRVILGSSDYLLREGIKVPGEDAELLVRHSVESSILYLAFDGMLRLGYEIDYRISGHFEKFVEQLALKQTEVAIHSYDPNINESFLLHSRRDRTVPIRVIKPIRFEHATDSNLTDSGVVATRSARDIARVMLSCDNLSETSHDMRRLFRIAAGVGYLLTVWLAVMGLINQTAPLIATLLQLALWIPTIFITRKNISNEGEDNNKYDQRTNKSGNGSKP